MKPRRDKWRRAFFGSKCTLETCINGKDDVDGCDCWPCHDDESRGPTNLNASQLHLQKQAILALLKLKKSNNNNNNKGWIKAYYYTSKNESKSRRNTKFKGTQNMMHYACLVRMKLKKQLCFFFQFSPSYHSCFTLGNR